MIQDREFGTHLQRVYFLQLVRKRLARPYSKRVPSKMDLLHIFDRAQLDKVGLNVLPRRQRQSLAVYREHLVRRSKRPRLRRRSHLEARQRQRKIAAKGKSRGVPRGCAADSFASRVLIARASRVYKCGAPGYPALHLQLSPTSLQVTHSYIVAMASRFLTSNPALAPLFAAVGAGEYFCSDDDGNGSGLMMCDVL